MVRRLDETCTKVATYHHHDLYILCSVYWYICSPSCIAYIYVLCWYELLQLQKNVLYVANVCSRELVISAWYTADLIP